MALLQEAVADQGGRGSYRYVGSDDAGSGGWRRWALPPASAAKARLAALGLATLAVTLGLAAVALWPQQRAQATADAVSVVGLAAGATRTGRISWVTHPGKCVSVPNGHALRLGDCSANTAAMKFSVPSSGTGAIRLMSHPHMCLDVAGGSAHNGNLVRMFDCLGDGGHANQQFTMPPGGKGPIRWASHPHKCVDVAAGRTNNGNIVHLWDCGNGGHGDANQQFTVLGCGGGVPHQPGPAPAPAPHKPAGGGFCGISSNIWDTPEHGNCDGNMKYLRTLDPHAGRHIHCKEYGGANDVCSIDVKNDKEFGLKKDPTACGNSPEPRVFFLWDEPTTHWAHPYPHCQNDGSAGKPACSVWSAQTWKKYADRWGAELTAARKKGLRVASPRFHGGEMMKHFAEFFGACPECSQKGSKYYIDIIAFNAWVFSAQHDNRDMVGNVNWMKGQAATLKQKYGNRPVMLADFATIGAQTAAIQAEVISKSRMFDWDYSGFDAVYYFAAKDYGGGTANNGLQEKVASGPHAGKTVGQVLLETCKR